MRSRLIVLFVPFLICGCADQAQRRDDIAQVRKQVSEETARICALPDAERQAQLERVKAEAGMAIVCPNR